MDPVHKHDVITRLCMAYDPEFGDFVVVTESTTSLDPITDDPNTLWYSISKAKYIAPIPNYKSYIHHTIPIISYMHFRDITGVNDADLDRPPTMRNKDFLYMRFPVCYGKPNMVDSVDDHIRHYDRSLIIDSNYNVVVPDLGLVIVNNSHRLSLYELYLINRRYTLQFPVVIGWPEANLLNECHILLTTRDVGKIPHSAYIALLRFLLFNEVNNELRQIHRIYSKLHCDDAEIMKRIDNVTAYIGKWQTTYDFHNLRC